MSASRISSIALAAAFVALSGSAASATIVAVNGGGNTPQGAQSHQTLEDLPASPKIVTPVQPHAPAGYNTWRTNFGRTSGPSTSPRSGPALKR
jgi:hypothetical protein